MELVLVHDLRCENLGFSVMIFSDRRQTSERHTVTRPVSPITSTLLLNTPIALSMGCSQMPRSARSGSRYFWFALSPVFAGQGVDHPCQLNPLVSRGPIGKLNGLVHALKLSLVTRTALHCAHRLAGILT
jgi:hypothetical protein